MAFLAPFLLMISHRIMMVCVAHTGIAGMPSGFLWPFSARSSRYCLSSESATSCRELGRFLTAGDSESGSRPLERGTCLIDDLVRDSMGAGEEESKEGKYRVDVVGFEEARVVVVSWTCWLCAHKGGYVGSRCGAAESRLWP